jgi:hypothetical protein
MTTDRHRSWDAWVARNKARPEWQKWTLLIVCASLLTWLTLFC